jgi:hypothetical protein
LLCPSERQLGRDVRSAALLHECDEGEQQLAGIMQLES